MKLTLRVRGFFKIKVMNNMEKKVTSGKEKMGGGGVAVGKRANSDPHRKKQILNKLNSRPHLFAHLYYQVTI